jgi:hypothetical protein
MAGTTLIAPVAMATTNGRSSVRKASVWENPRVQHTPFPMSRVVATDGDGQRKLQIPSAGPPNGLPRRNIPLITAA